MRKVTPYRNQKSALKAIDNGGRFYNLLTKADDGLITSAELSKAAGVHGNLPLMHLYLEMSLFELAEAESVKAALSDNLRQSNQKYQPLVLSPSEANNNTHIGKTVIVTGVPHYTKSNTKFSGFIMVPMITNNVTTMTMIPLMSQYDVYELRDTTHGKNFLMAHTHSSKKLEPVETRIGGALKELKKSIDTTDIDVFLEACYYTKVC
jgi:hypothetical protein